MKVKELMNRNIFKVNISTPLKDIVKILLAENTGCVIVTNNNNDIAGIITSSDLFRFLFPDYNEIREHGEYLFDPILIEQRIYQRENMTAETLMTKFPELINLESPAIEAAVVMKEYKIKQLPVIDNEKLVGVITFKDILESFVNKMRVLNY